MVELVVPDRFRPDEAPDWFEQWNRIVDQADLSLVFSQASFVSAAGSVLLAAGTAARRSRGLATKIVAPAELMLSFVPRSLAAIQQASSRRDADEHRSSRVSSEMECISDLRHARFIADVIAEVLESDRPTLSASVIRMTRFVVEELGANVVQHSGRAETGFGVASIGSPATRFQIAFADCGVGLLMSLQRNPELMGRIVDDADALQLALNSRITGTSLPRTNMGIGLKMLTDFSDLLDGDLWIASGSAMLHRRTIAGQRTNSIRPIPSWQGVWICLDASVA